MPVGSPEELTTSELHQRVKEVIEPVLAKRDDVLSERLATRLGTGLASADLDELIGATAQVGTDRELRGLCHDAPPLPAWTLRGQGRQHQAVEALQTASARVP